MTSLLSAFPWTEKLLFLVKTGLLLPFSHGAPRLEKWFSASPFLKARWEWMECLSLLITNTLSLLTSRPTTKSTCSLWPLVTPSGDGPWREIPTLFMTSLSAWNKETTDSALQVYVTYTSGTRTEQRRKVLVLQALTVSIVGMIRETPTLEVRMEASTTGLTEVLPRRLLLTKASSALSDIVKDSFLLELLME